MYSQLLKFIIPIAVTFVLPMFLHAFYQEEIKPRLQLWRRKTS